MTQETKYAIDISVETQYLSDESSPGDNVYSFAYTVTITNRGNIPTQLISRHWFIEDDAEPPDLLQRAGLRPADAAGPALTAAYLPPRIVQMTNAATSTTAIAALR